MEQNQLTPGQTNLQQQSTSNLQQNNSALQNSGSPATSSGSSQVLSQAYRGDLQVQSVQTVQNGPSQTYLPKDPVFGWLILPLFLITAVIALYVWLRMSKEEAALVPDTTEPEPLPVVAAAKPKSKKPKNQKKTTRKQRARSRK